MKAKQLYLFPLIRLLAVRQSEYMTGSYFADLRSVALLNSIIDREKSIAVFVEDIMMVPALDVLCQQQGFPLIETHSSSANLIYKGIHSYIERTPNTGYILLIIPEYILFLLHRKLYCDRKTLIDNKSIPAAYWRVKWNHDQCPECGEHTIFLEEGALICYSCMHSVDY